MFLPPILPTSSRQKQFYYQQVCWLDSSRSGLDRVQHCCPTAGSPQELPQSNDMLEERPPGDNTWTEVVFVCFFVEVSLSALKLMIFVANVWSTESRGVIYNINSVAPCCDQKCNRLRFVPPPIIHLLLGDAASGLPSKLAGGSLFLRAAARHNTAGATLWARRRERFSGCGGISSGSAHPDSLRLTVGWCWQRRPRPACACTWRWPRTWRWWAIRAHRRRRVLRLSSERCWDNNEIGQAGLVKEIRLALNRFTQIQITKKKYPSRVDDLRWIRAKI